MSKSRINGTGVAMITPFKKGGTVDFTSMEKIIEHLIKNKVDYLVPLGTTGETPTIFNEERTAIIDFVIDVVAGRVPIVVGMGGNSTQEVVDFIKQTDFSKIDAILSVCPYYNKPNQKGIFNHYKTIAGISPVPVIIYNVPGRTGANISADTTLKIARELPNVLGIKEASGDLTQIMQILKNRPKGFQVISGDDGITLPLLSIGVDGVISVVANAYPKQFSTMVNQGLKGEFAKANIIHYQLIDFIESLFADGSPGGIKAAMEIMGFCESHVRLPLAKISKKHYSELKEMIGVI